MFFLSAEEDNLTELVSKATHPNVGLVHQVNTVQLLILVFPPSLSLSHSFYSVTVCFSKFNGNFC